MPKTAVAAALAALILATVTPTAQAMPMVPHHTVFAGLSADLQDVSWRRCWRDRLGAATLPDLLARPLGTRPLPLTPGAGPDNLDGP